MIIKKMTKVGLAFALLGLGMFVGCSDDNSSVASTLSETNTGKSIAELDTSLLASSFDEGSDCLESSKILAKRMPMMDFEISCETRDILRYYIDTRVRVVDSKGQPMVGAKVYFTDCLIGEDCEEITDEKGYVYADSVMFLKHYFHKGEEDKGTLVYSELNLRIVSADGNIGAKVTLEFEEAKVFSVDGKSVAELQAVAEEKLYSTKLYVDTLITYYESSLKSVGDLNPYLNSAEVPEFLVCVDEYPLCTEETEEDRKNLSHKGIVLLLCTEVTEEDRKNGYVIIVGLPEGSYSFRVGSRRFGLMPVDEKLEVKP